MLLNITPSGNEFQRKMLLEHSSQIRNIFLISLCLIPIAIAIGSYYAKPIKSDEQNDYMRNVAMILADNGEQSISQGTAFLVCDQSGLSSGYLFTAKHVIDRSESNQVVLRFPDITDENNEPLTTTASIIWSPDVKFDGNDVNTLRYDVA